MRKYNHHIIFILIVLGLFASCDSVDKRPKRKAEPGLTFFDYRVRGDEERNVVTITLRFRDYDADGDPFSLVAPAKVEFDGLELTPDSSVMNGVYYETSTTVPEFVGDHSIVYTDGEGRTFTEEFSFVQPVLLNELPSKFARQDLVLELGGVDSTQQIQVLMNDTSFYSRGIEIFDTVRNGRIVISQAELGRLRDGPVFLEIYREKNATLREATPAGGRLTLSYNLKRSFELLKAEEPKGEPGN
ncbi:MAG TPA: hypothetical protein PK951_08130 [Chitinophagaceae bacterium]|nr:hypothetical protein [Chitinophagaceae bacterium]HUM64488.1 hypothetical protein [Chitinophagaceae bacterium]